MAGKRNALFVLVILRAVLLPAQPLCRLLDLLPIHGAVAVGVQALEALWVVCVVLVGTVFVLEACILYLHEKRGVQRNESFRHLL